MSSWLLPLILVIAVGVAWYGGTDLERRYELEDRV